jgi:hypothetical protein
MAGRGRWFVGADCWVGRRKVVCCGGGDRCVNVVVS